MFNRKRDNLLKRKEDLNELKAKMGIMDKYSDKEYVTSESQELMNRFLNAETLEEKEEIYNQLKEIKAKLPVDLDLLLEEAREKQVSRK